MSETTEKYIITTVESYVKTGVKTAKNYTKTDKNVKNCINDVKKSLSLCQNVWKRCLSCLIGFQNYIRWKWWQNLNYCYLKQVKIKKSDVKTAKTFF